MINFIKKNYIAINIVFLILACYVILFPIIIIPIRSVAPEFLECPYLKMTGNPCPLCGGTRYIQNIPSNLLNIKYFLHPFGAMILFIIFELIFRIINLIKKYNGLKLIKFDIIIHIIAIILFFAYEILFFIL